MELYQMELGNVPDLFWSDCFCTDLSVCQMNDC